MKVNVEKERIVLVPETEFEQQAMYQILGQDMRCFHKHGVDLTDYVGLVIEPDIDRPKVDPEWTKRMNELEKVQNNGPVSDQRFGKLDNDLNRHLMNESSISIPGDYHPDFPDDFTAGFPKFEGFELKPMEQF